MARRTMQHVRPLRYVTPRAWAKRVLDEPLKLLNDHAHLEKKAASNALELLSRWPDRFPPPSWVQTMTAVARDEVEHLAVVTKLLSRRGGKLTRSHRNPYAKALRGLVRNGVAGELIDRLLISALIEARSWERFDLLAEQTDDRQLSRLYENLATSERGHYEVFVGLARDLFDRDEAEARWDEMLDAEAAIIAEQPAYVGMHSGVK